MPVGRNNLVETGISLVERNELVGLAEMYMGHEIFVWNANINGILIQLRTNDAHLDDFWRENWFPALGIEHEHTTRPHGIIYAVTNVPETEAKACYHGGTKTAIVINKTNYDVIRSVALGIATDVSEEQKDMHFMRGALIDVNGEGVVITGDMNSGKTTQTFLLLELDRARVHSNDWIYVERLGGERGRISTLVSERKFLVKSTVAQISPRIKELIGKCKSRDGFFILDPWWIGGQEKFVDTTRIKIIFILQRRPSEGWVCARIPQREAIALLRNAPDPFFNPHWLVRTEDRMALQTSFFQDILQFAACYRVNTAAETLEVQKRIREIIKSKEYLIQVREGEDTLQVGEIIRPEELQSVGKTMAKLFESKNVAHPDAEALRAMAVEYGTKTKFGNYNFVSSVKHRSADLTVAVGSQRVMVAKLNDRQKQILKNLPKTLQNVHDYVQKAPFVCVQRTMGQNDIFMPTCRLFVSTHRKEMLRLAYMVGETLLPDKGTGKPLLQLLHIPEWQEKDRQILVFPEMGITYVLGSDYYGEDKKGLLRMAMWEAKQRGMLGLHAGTKIIRAKDKATGKIKKYSMVIFGLTATGKTTHTCHDHGLTGEGEGVEIVQDDVVFLRPDGLALGTERGFYLKTEGVDSRILPLIYKAATRPPAIFENVLVDYRGNVSFGDQTLTGNGRGIMQRADFGKQCSESLNIPPLSELDGMIILFITRRNTVVPPVAKLNAEQAAAAFMLGESIETTGSDPARAGESVREIGTNPFIVGDPAYEGEFIYDFARKNADKLQFYLFNTGAVGEVAERTPEGERIILQKGEKIGIPESAAIIRAICRGEIEWRKSEYFDMLVPKEVPGMDISRYDLERFYTKELAEAYVRDLVEERVQWLSSFKGLNPAIVQSVKR